MIVTRFAPAPTGWLHLGHVVNAAYVWGTARAAGGRILLRLEDHDRTRSRPEYERAILEDLAWLGFVADSPLVRQSERQLVYESALQVLRARGRVYACDCSRRDIEAASSFSATEVRYPGTCGHKTLAETDRTGLRFRVDAGVERFDDVRHGSQAQQPFDQCGDLLLRGREGNWTYQYAVTVDDWRQGVTLVIRGDDLLSSTGRQIQLARILGRPSPPIFLHHPLVMKTASQKLSKSDDDSGVRALRARGWTPADVIGEACRLGGLTDDRRPIAANELAAVSKLIALAAVALERHSAAEAAGPLTR